MSLELEIIGANSRYDFSQPIQRARERINNFIQQCTIHVFIFNTYITNIYTIHIFYKTINIQQYQSYRFTLDYLPNNKCISSLNPVSSFKS